MHPLAIQLLLVDDDPSYTALIKQLLEDAGPGTFHVHSAPALLPGLDRLARGGIDLVLLDASLPGSRGLDGLNAIRAHAPDLPVVLMTGTDSDAMAISGAEDCLAKETLEGPALAQILRNTVVRHQVGGSRAAPAGRPQGQVLGWMGAKGGVGTTTIACHVALELRRQTGGRVLLIDADTSGNDIGFLLNVSGAYGISNAAADILHLDRERWEKLVAATPSGVDVMQSGGPVWQEERQPMAGHVQSVLRFVRSIYDWVVVDLGRLSCFSSGIAEDVDQLFLVSTGDLLGLNDAKAAAASLWQAGISRDCLSLLLNQTPSRSPFSRREVEKLLGLTVRSMLPECRDDFLHAAMNGKRLGESRKVRKQIAQLVAGLARMEEPSPRRSRFGFLTALRSEAAGRS